MLKSKKLKTIFFLTIALVVVAGIYYFYNLKTDEKKKTEIKIDENNTEIIVNQKEIEEIESRLDELDINLDDIVKELDIN